MNLLVTGGCGFIGANLVRHLRRERPGWRIINLDALTYAGHRESVAGLEGDAHHLLVHGDVRDGAGVSRVIAEHRVEAVVHLAAETHVDRSILGAEAFLQTNVIGTQRMLEAARAHGVRRFVHVSTDEVYGSLGAVGAFTEDSPLRPSSPYAASKASADLLALAWHRTFGLEVVVTRSTNNFGPYQLPEKLLPLLVVRAMRDEPLPVYGDGQQIRDWIHVEDHCAALLRVLEAGRAGEVYHVSAMTERSNLSLVERVLSLLGKPTSLIRHVEDRPGHDRRYALDSTRLRTELGWVPGRNFDAALEETVRWYAANQAWLERVTAGEFGAFIQAQYAKRLSDGG